MTKKLFFAALLALPFTATVGQASSYLPYPDCYPCVTSASPNYLPYPDCYPCIVDNSK